MLSWFWSESIQGPASVVACALVAKRFFCIWGTFLGIGRRAFRGSGRLVGAVDCGLWIAGLHSGLTTTVPCSAPSPLPLPVWPSQLISHHSVYLHTPDFLKFAHINAQSFTKLEKPFGPQ
ncbi:hypothetical protein J6590_028636 [Homalodisca vitripennis]|nr:hypothetical protein J6590_028636 [Homalodisca vitripennis]